MIMLHNKPSRFYSIIQRKHNLEMGLKFLPELDFCGHNKSDHFEHLSILKGLVSLNN